MTASLKDESIRALLTSTPPHTGKLATVRADGRPHVAPVWFLLDEDDSIVFNTGATTVKGRNLLRNRYAALSIDDEQPPFSFVMIEGAVTTSEDPADVRHWATRLGGRYMGEENAEAFGARNGVPGELLVRLHPEHVVGSVDLAD